jgi:aminoglycoside phosphotransferase family enzyme/predicted kinase
MHKSTGDETPARIESTAQTPSLSGAQERLVTELSWLFFRDDLVYKVKRPIKLNGRDYRTLDAREKACQRELRINRAVAGDVYQDVVPLYDRGGSWTLDADGAPCEYGVRMALLPPDRMLDVLLEQNRIGASELAELAGVIAEFYQAAKSGEKIARAAASSNLEANIHCAIKCVTENGGSSARLAYLESALLQFLAGHREQFEKRLTQNKIRDCHGELRASHICMTSPPILFARPEYSDRARHRDILDDVAGLLLDLDRLGKPKLAGELWGLIATRLGEKPEDPLLDFYRAYGALLRAKHEYLLPETAAEGKRSLEQAADYCARFHIPRMFVTIGPMGSGKTTLAQALAQGLGMRRISATQIREKLFPAADPKAKPCRLSPEQIVELYEHLCSSGAESLREGVSVVLDADFLKREHRGRAVAAARSAGCVPLFLECRISRNDAIARLDNRRRKNRTLARTRPELFEEQLEGLEPADDVMPDCLLPLNSNQPVPALVETVIKTAFNPPNRN